MPIQRSATNVWMHAYVWMHANVWTFNHVHAFKLRHSKVSGRYRRRCLMTMFEYHTCFCFNHWHSNIGAEVWMPISCRRMSRCQQIGTIIQSLWIPWRNVQETSDVNHVFFNTVWVWIPDYYGTERVDLSQVFERCQVEAPNILLKKFEFVLAWIQRFIWTPFKQSFN